MAPQFVPARWWQTALHMNTALILRGRLLRQRDIVAMEAPYQTGTGPQAEEATA